MTTATLVALCDCTSAQVCFKLNDCLVRHFTQSQRCKSHGGAGGRVGINKINFLGTWLSPKPAWFQTWFHCSPSKGCLDISGGPTDQTNRKSYRSMSIHVLFCFHYREQTWQWLLSPSPTCVKRSSTSPSPSWTWASASCIVNPTPPKTASSPSWTPWLLTSGSTSSWPTWVLVVSFLSLPGKSRSYLPFVLSVLYTFSKRSFNRHSNLLRSLCRMSTPASFSYCVCCWVVIKAVMSAWALYRTAVGGGIEKSL